jgi:hypothetical protein
VAELRKLALLLMSISLVYVAFAWFRYLSYQEWIREKTLSYPEPVRPFVDFAPFQSSKEGATILAGGALLGIAWVLYLSRKTLHDLFITI